MHALTAVYGVFEQYGNQAIVLLEEIAKSGDVNPAGLTSAFNAAFKAGGKFERGPASYHDASTRGVVANVAAGKV